MQRVAGCAAAGEAVGVTTPLESRMRCRKPGCSRRFTRPQGSRRIYCPECSPPRKPLELDDEPAPVVRRFEGPIVASVRLELEQLDVGTSVEAAIALRIAQSLDDPDLAASSVSALAGQLSRILAGLRERAPRRTDRLDELGERLARKLGTA